MTNYLTTASKYLATTIKYIIVAVVSFLLGYCCYPYINNSTTNYTTANSTTASNKHEDTIIKDTTQVSIKDKVSTDDPDLVVDNRYVTRINGETIEIPMKPNQTKQDTTATVLEPGKTLAVSNEINLDPVVRKLADAEYKRNWEVSTGIGKSHDGDWYIPIGLQRNYNYDRALEVSVGVSKDHIENVQVVHKWKF